MCDREQVASNARARSGGRYTAAGEAQAIHYYLDEFGKVYAVVTSPKYSPRVGSKYAPLPFRMCHDTGGALTLVNPLVQVDGWNSCVGVPDPKGFK